MAATGCAPAERVAVVKAAAGVVEVAAALVTATAIDDRQAMGDVSVVVIDHLMAMPVASPVMPGPPKSSEVSDSKSTTEGDCRAGKKDSGHRNPARVGDHRYAVREPRIIGRHIDHIRVGWFDDDRVALIRYLLLFIAIQLAGLPSLLTHRLDGIGHFLLLVGVCVPKR